MIFTQPHLHRFALIVSDPIFQVEVGASGSDHGSSLIISLAKDEDGGQYVCEMGTGGGEAIKHTVHIRGMKCKAHLHCINV